MSCKRLRETLDQHTEEHEHCQMDMCWAIKSVPAQTWFDSKHDTKFDLFIIMEWGRKGEMVFNRFHGLRADAVRQHTILTQDQVDEIRSNHIPHHPDYSFAAFGRRFGVDPGTIRAAYMKKSWKKLVA